MPGQLADEHSGACAVELRRQARARRRSARSGYPPGNTFPAVSRPGAAGGWSRVPGSLGYASAGTLTDHGHEVKVFDKGRGPGGRTATRRVDPNWAFDHGAQYFTARDSHFVHTVGDWLEKGVVAEWGGRVVRLQAGTATDTTPQPRTLGCRECPPLPPTWPRIWPCAGSHVSQASLCSPDGWQLVDESGCGYGPFDSLVVALPRRRRRNFSRRTPSRSRPEASRFPRAGPYSRRSRTGSTCRGMRPSSTTRRCPGSPGIVPSPAARGTDCWVLHASPAWSAAHLEEAPDAVGPQLLAAFAAALWRPVPEPIYRAVHRWRYSPGADPEARATLFDADAGLAVCGDWLGGGRVEGAFLSGIAAADRVLREVGVPHSPTGGDAFRPDPRS